MMIAMIESHHFRNLDFRAAEWRNTRVGDLTPSD